MAGAEAMGQAAYREMLSIWKENMLPPRAMRQKNRCLEVPQDDHSQGPTKLHGIRP